MNDGQPDSKTILENHNAWFFALHSTKKRRIALGRLRGVLKDKDILNYKSETVLGPALREGYWTPEAYEDPGESRIVENIPRNDSNSGVVLKFDDEPFEGEELNYYYASIDD